MTNVRTIHVDWYNRHSPSFHGGPQLAYQGDHLSNMVVFDNAPELPNYYLLVEMKTDEAGPVVTLPEILLEGAYWVIPNYYTQICQKITYQVCCKTESGDFEHHSAKFEGTILPVLKHDGEPIDQSPMFDPYIDILDKKVTELVVAAGDIQIDSELKSDSGNPVQNRVVKAAIDGLEDDVDAVNGRLDQQENAADNLKKGLSAIQKNNLKEIFVYDSLGTPFTYTRLPVVWKSGELYAIKIKATAPATITEIGLSTNTAASGIVTVLDENVSLDSGSEKTYYGINIDDTIRTIYFLHGQFTGEITFYRYLDSLDGVTKDDADFIGKNISDLLYGQLPYINTFVSNSNGTKSLLIDFYTYEIEIGSGISKVYPFNDFSDSNKIIRSMCFFDGNGDFISGVSGSSTDVVNGVEVPSGTKTIKASLHYKVVDDKRYIADHYLSTSRGNTKDYALASDVCITGQNKSNIRKACVNFQFDDGHANDANIVTIFKSHNLTCGFALISDLTSENVARYLGYQSDGFEALCHADSGTGMNDASVSVSTIENRLKTSKEILESYGFIINGFVTPNSTMALVFRPLLRKYFQFAETVYFGEYSGAGKPYRNPTDGVYNGYRVSLQSTTLANAKAAIDATIANYGCLTFYGHSADMDSTNNLTTENLTELLAYVNTKITSGELVCGNPSDVIRNYFDVRNDDVSDGWIDVTATEASLDSRFTVNKWYMSYNIKLGLLFFAIRVAPSEDVSGQIQLFTFPKSVLENQLIPNESGRIAFSYNGKLLINGSSTLAQGVNYRFSGMLRLDQR